MVVSNLLLMPGTNGHRSASQRREELLRAMNDHLLQIIAVLALQQGGIVLVPGALLRRAYDLTAKRDALTGDIVYTASVTGQTQEPLMPALNDAAAEKEPT